MHQKKISLTSAIILTINMLVGSAILAFPGLMTGIAGNASFLSWGIVALIFLPLVLGAVELSRLFPGAGGFYTYVKEGMGQEVGYLAGWLYVVGYTFSIVLEGLALRKVVTSYCMNIVFLNNTLTFNLIFLGFLVLFNAISLRVMSRFLNFFTICKVLPLILLILLIPFIFNPNFSITGAGLSLLPGSIPLAIFGYLGFEYCCNIAQHIENSKQNGPRAILIGFLATALIYMLFHFGLLNLMGAQKLAECGAPAYASFLNMPIPYLREFITFLIPIASIIAIGATAIALFSANVEILYVMAQERLFYNSNLLSKINSYDRPHVIIALQGLIIFIIITCVPYIAVINGLCNVACFLGYLLPFISLLILQRQVANYKKISLTVLALIIIVGLIFYNWLFMGDTMLERLLYTALLFGIIGSGFLIRNREQGSLYNE